ncbi:MAG: Ig domain-containing protein, partial [Lachnospiraceae bacterium]|nr:Ig domain-containing protein [Lachnospiraceae bacterium]
MYTFTIMVTDSASPAKTDSHTYTIVIQPLPLEISTINPAKGTVDKVYNSHTFTSTGGTGAKTYDVTGGSLPGGMTLSTEGVLSGTPNEIGMYTFTIMVTDSASPAKTDSHTYTIVIQPLPLEISTINPAKGTVDKVYNSHTFTSTGGTGAKTYAVTGGSLPRGMTLSTAGVLSGTPTEIGARSFTVTVTDSASPAVTASRTYIIVIKSKPIQINAENPVNTADSATATNSTVTNSTVTNITGEGSTSTGSENITMGSSSKKTAGNIERKEKTPYLTGKEGMAGWEAIMSEMDDRFDEAVQKDSVIEIVEMNGDTVLPANMLALIRGKNMELNLKMGDGISWTINGMNVTEVQLYDIDLSVSRNTDKIPKDILEEIRKGNDSIQIELAHNGSFGFHATLTMAFDEIDAGQYANLFYYNEETRELEYMESSLVEVNGLVDFDLDHASAYTIILSNEPMSASALSTDNSESTKLTQDNIEADNIDMQTTNKITGNTMLWWILLGIMIVAVIGGVTIYIRKKNQGTKKE